MTKKENDNIMNLQKLKDSYQELAKKYSLPPFTELNALFDIEEISTETELLLRKIRRVIIEKISGYLRFVEIIVNPASTPAFFYKKIRKLDSTDKEMLSNMYETFGNLETESLLLDLSYDEKKEVEFIKKVVALFNSQLKEELTKIIKKLINAAHSENKNNRGSYFG